MNPAKNPQFSHLKAAFSRLLDWFLPPLCPATGQVVDAHGMIAPEYWVTLRFITRPFCPSCAIPHPFDTGTADMLCPQCLTHPNNFTRARAALVYDDASKKVILRFKHADQLQAIRTLVPWMLRAGDDVLNEADILLPVPLHRFRFLRRRYNQSALLSNALAKVLKKRSINDAILRTKKTAHQAGKTAEERRENVKNAFTINPKYAPEIMGKNIVLIDDVFTTGATLNACAKTLLKAGAKNVDVVCIARATRD